MRKENCFLRNLVIKYLFCFMALAKLFAEPQIYILTYVFVLAYKNKIWDLFYLPERTPAPMIVPAAVTASFVAGRRDALTELAGACGGWRVSGRGGGSGGRGEGRVSHPPGRRQSAVAAGSGVYRTCVSPPTK